MPGRSWGRINEQLLLLRADLPSRSHEDEAATTYRLQAGLSLLTGRSLHSDILLRGSIKAHRQGGEGMSSPTYAGNSFLTESGLFKGSKCKLTDLPCASDDCRRCNVALVFAMERLTDAINLSIMTKGGQ